MRNADIFSWEHLPLITLTPPSWPTFLRLHVKSIHRSQCKNPKHSKIHSQYVSSLLRPFPKFFPRCCWNLKISHLTLGFQVEPTFHNFSTLVTPMAGQTPVVCFQSQPRVPPMHKNPFSGFPGQLSADGWIGRQVNLDRCVFTRGDSQVITSRIPSLYCRKQTSLEPNCGFLLVQTHYRKKEKSAIVWKHFINTAGGGAAILKKGRVYSTSCLEPGRPPGRIRPLLTVLTHRIINCTDSHTY